LRGKLRGAVLKKAGKSKMEKLFEQAAENAILNA